MHLLEGTLLKNGEYRIEKVLASGGFGITYLAGQVALGRKVAVKEFFMKDICNRDENHINISVPSVGSKELVSRFRQKFLKEARLIASFDHSNIIRIHDVFEENGTAYYVMEYLEGESLGALVSRQGALDEQLAVRYIRQIASALAEVHAANLLHLDVKPANIMLKKKGDAVLIDFGISKHYDDSGSQTSSAPVGISEGYAPLEQYESGALYDFSPATDIYSLGATLYFLLTGHRPPKAGDVMNDGLPVLPEDISLAVRNAIGAAMIPRRKDRPQSIAEFLEILDGAESVVQGTAGLAGDTELEVPVVPVEVAEVQSTDNRERSTKEKVIKAGSKKAHLVNEEVSQSVGNDVECNGEDPEEKEVATPAQKGNRSTFNRILILLLGLSVLCAVVLFLGRCDNDSVDETPRGDDPVVVGSDKEGGSKAVGDTIVNGGNEDAGGKNVGDTIMDSKGTVGDATVELPINDDVKNPIEGGNVDNGVKKTGNANQVESNTNKEVKNFVENGICYNVTDNVNNRVEVAIGKYTGTIVIPETVVHNNIAYSVTGIGVDAFWHCSGLTAITIPYSVTSIEGRAFANCSGLTSITIPNGVTSIGEGAFSYCKGLTSITIPNSVKSIGESAFYGCSGLTSITIPNSVTIIGKYAFYGCSGLTSITIPNGVTSIGNGALSCCSGLTSITIPNGVTSIGEGAFYYCKGLTRITIPNSVTSIGRRAFSQCFGLTSVEIQNKSTKIGEDAFYGTPWLKNQKK